MAAKKQTIKDGTIVHFKGYDPGEDGEVPEGDLNTGDKLKVVGYDAEQETYNVVSVEDESITDSLFTSEFEVPKGEAKTKAAAKKTAKTKKTKAAPVVEEVEEEEVEEEVEEEEPEEEEVEEEVEEEEVEEEVEETAPAPKPKRTRKAKPAPPVEEEEEVLLPFKKTASFSKALKDHDGDVLTAARQVADARDKSTYVLGGILAFAKRNNTHLEILDDETGEPFYSDDLAGFNQWMNDEVGVAPRNGNYYLDIYEVFSQVTTESKIAKIGWTKLRELLPARRILTKDNADEFIAFAKDNATKDVVAHVREKLVDAGIELHGRQKTANMKTFKFSAHDDQAEVINEAFDLAKTKLGDKSTDAQVWNQIATDYLAMHAPEQG